MKQASVFHIMGDFRADTPYDAAIEFSLKSNWPQIPLVKSNINFQKTDLVSPTVFLDIAWKQFPDNTLHFLLFHISENMPERFLAIKIQNQTLLTPDLGIISAIENQYPLSPFKIAHEVSYPDAFFDVYLPFVQNWLGKNDWKAVATKEYKTIQLPQTFVQNNRIIATVLYNDALGNAYLNIKKEEFETLVDKKKYKILITRSTIIQQIVPEYTALREGEILAKFGYGDYLQIACNAGNAANMYNLKKDKQIIIEIENE